MNPDGLNRWLTLGPTICVCVRRGDVKEKLTPDEQFRYRRWAVLDLSP